MSVSQSNLPSSNNNKQLASTARFYGLWTIVVLLAIGAGVLIGTQTDLYAQLFSWLGEETPWYMTRSSGIVAYLLLSGSMMWGLVISTQSVRGQVPPPVALATHNVLSWLALLLSLIHAVVLRASTFFEYSWLDIFVPFRGPYRPIWVGLGVVAFYLMFVVNVSFDWRRWLGQRTWRWLHYATFLIYLLVTVHVIQSGSDIGEWGMQLVVVGSVTIFLFLTVFRLLMGQRGRRSR